MADFFEHHAWATSPGPWHEPAEALLEAPPAAHPARLIAYYLPQFHREPVNDAAWGAGFTEWTNVTKALPRLVGQVQPRLPADLGFYDLTDVETIAAQAALAKRAGIWGFCIHDYWFSGRKVLETPLNLILAHPELDLRFCLNWANETWSRRWDGSENEIIVAQRHAQGDAEAYIDSIAPALRDPRYIRVDGRPLLMMYRPGALPDAADTVRRWRERAREIGIGDLYLVMARAFDEADPRRWGFDAAAGFPPHMHGPHAERDRRLFAHLDPDFRGRTFLYEEMARAVSAQFGENYRLLPGVCPSWDNGARRGLRGTTFLGATPAKYGAWLRTALRRATGIEDPEERIVFVNAWNEWAEGAVLEPDRHYGHAWLAETRRAVDAVAADPKAGETDPWPEDDRTPLRFRSRPSRLNYLRNRALAASRRLGLAARRSDRR